MDLTQAEWALLDEIGYESWRGRGARPGRSPERSRLRRLGFIASASTNSGICPGVVGRNRFWNPTEAGLAALEARSRAGTPLMGELPDRIRTPKEDR